MTRALPLLLLLASCGGKDPVLPPPTGAGVEDCTNGADDDGDGLLDCEDDDCAGSAACVEDDCGNTEDDDGDGFVDCADADCWGNGCAVAQSKITASGRVTRKDAALDFFTSAPGCSSYHLDTATITIESPSGTLNYLSPMAGDDFVTCGWSATRSWILDVNPQGEHFDQPRLLLREGFAVDPSCPVQDPTFLPLALTLDEGVDMWAMRTGVTGGGPPWFGWQGSSSLIDNTSVNQPNVGSCNHTIVGSRQTVSWATPDVDFDFWIAAPTFQLPANP